MIIRIILTRALEKIEIGDAVALQGTTLIKRASSNDTIVGVARRAIEKGEVIEFVLNENTKDIVSRFSSTDGEVYG